MTRTFTLYGCAPCHTRWWTVDAEPNPGHVCSSVPAYPAAGMLVAQLVESDPPHSVRQAA